MTTAHSPLRNHKKYIIINPGKFPFFYGYIVAIVGTIAVWASFPGQTIGVSTFTNPMMEALNLSRDWFSAAYMIGTGLSSLFIARAGKWFDKYGARKVAFYASIGLSVSIYLCSVSDNISSQFQSLLNTNSKIIPFVVITILFLILRFSGQGVLTLAARTMVMKWFDNFRGRINALSSVAVSLGFSISPVLVTLLIDDHGWKGAWHILALGMLIIIVMIWIFFRDNPEQFKLKPDGNLSNNTSRRPSEARKQYTLTEATATRAFWMYTFMLAFNAFFSTGLSFHIESIFANVGHDKAFAVSIFFRVSVVAVITSLIGNALSDGIRLKIYLYLFILGGIIASTGLILLKYDIGYYILFTGAGLMSGFFAILTAVAWPRFYGRKNLGAISGKSLGIIVFASALGPFIFSLANTYLHFSFSGSFASMLYLTNSYAGIGFISFVFLGIVAMLSIKADNPQ